MLVLASQLSAAALNGFAKFFETGEDPVHPFQVLFVRFLITGTACTFYLWFTKAPNFPLGLPELRWLLVLRAAAGVFGAFGFYFSIMYLKLSEATALNFLGPLTAMILIRYLDYGTFEVIDRIGAFVALIGVILVVQPDALFGSKPTLASAAQSIADGSPKGRMMGFGFGLISVCGGAVALTAIRSIGTREHPLMSIMYFAWTIVTVSTVAFLLMDSVHLTTTVMSWVKLIPLGIFGFTMASLNLWKFTISTGIANDVSSAATIMIYSQVGWALLLDWIVFHSQVNLLTLIGIGGVVTSLIVVSSAKEWKWLRKGRYEVVEQDSLDEREPDEEVVEMRPNSSVA
ncbi:hypothetical protein BDP81DRAFT_387644 [Colletotrichum phormii]|uniref:EamA domain-containing protein n=1 Tax=Colletotrichum phormii TaxID=359342 RepID=A0AAJ0E9C4_9PEZI|nr:uncharacterized protein BDP81DRAFT_387644 [Colletotrichum phormii]KAK1621618.1 hypothetical protein BDP81DRAFT_387644 [Colletotrichum phormii]